MNKYIYIGALCLGVFLIPGATINETCEKTIVCEMYIKECEVCGYDKMEGYYSYIDRTGYEECKKCGYYVEINNN